MQNFIEYCLSGGLFTVVIGLFTLNSKIKKTRAEAETLDLSNSEKATGILMKNIVEPLQKELHETRKSFADTKMEMERLRLAIKEANACRYAAHCPVLQRVRRQSHANRRVEGEGVGDGLPEDDTAADDLPPAAPGRAEGPPGRLCGGTEKRGWRHPVADPS